MKTVSRRMIAHEKTAPLAQRSSELGAIHFMRTEEKYVRTTQPKWALRKRDRRLSKLPRSSKMRSMQVSGSVKLKDLIKAGVGDGRWAGAWGSLLPAVEVSLMPLLEVEMPMGSRVEIAEPGDERDPVASELISIYIPLTVDQGCEHAGGRYFDNAVIKMHLEYFWAGYAEHGISIFDHYERFVENVKDQFQVKCDIAGSIGGCALLILKGVLTAVVPSESAGCVTLGLNYSGEVVVWTGRSWWDYWIDAKWRKLMQNDLRYDLECFGVKRLDDGHLQASYSRIPAKNVRAVGRIEWIRLLGNS